MDWEQLDLHPQIIAAVNKANLKSGRDILTYSVVDLQRLTQLSIGHIHRLQKAVSATLQKNTLVTALQLYREKTIFPSQHQKLSLGCSVLNNLLRGGVPLVGITELAGESAAGKTQIALQLCLSVQYPVEYGGLGAGAVYICTEDAFPSTRLQQLMRLQPKQRAEVPADFSCSIRFGDHIFIEHAADIEMLTDCITKKLPVLLRRGQIRLIVIDSIAALFRSEFAASDAVLKAKHLQTLGAKLHQLSSSFTTPVFCINQAMAAPHMAVSAGDPFCSLVGFAAALKKHVTDTVKETDSVLAHCGLQDRKVLPALGISWSNQLLMRLMVTRTQRMAPPPHTGSVLRTMEVIFAPHIPRATGYYTVDLEGVKGIDGEGT